MPVKNTIISGLEYLLEQLKIQTDECQIWPFNRNWCNYGLVWVDGKRIRAHRQAQKLTDPNFDESLKSLHRCDNPPCFNPRHLFQGTQSDNMADMDKKGRRVNVVKGTPNPQNRGAGNGNAKLNEDKVREIRRRYATGEYMKFIARDIGASEEAIRHVVIGKTWSHVI